MTKAVRIDLGRQTPTNLPDSTERVASLNDVAERLQRAFTRQEVDEALSHLDEHLRRYPEDRGIDIAPGFEANLQALLKREQVATVMELSDGEISEREALLKSMLTWDIPSDPFDTTLLQQKENRLLDWLRQHPEDTTVQGYLESVQTDRRLVELVQVS